jgi:hypothetical protein
MGETTDYTNSIYLEQGDYSVITPEIHEIADGIKGAGIEYLENLNILMQKNRRIVRGNVDRYQRDTKTILFDENGDLKREKDGKIEIGGCTESARVFRTFCLAKNIPTRLVETISKDWIKNRDLRNKKDYIGHVFPEVFIDDKWYVIEHMVESVPDRMNKSWIGQRDGNKIQLGGGEEYKIVSWGIDHTDMITPEGDFVNFKTEKDYNDFVDKRYPIDERN